jgi:hypothetical protein
MGPFCSISKQSPIPRCRNLVPSRTREICTKTSACSNNRISRCPARSRRAAVPPCKQFYTGTLFVSCVIAQERLHLHCGDARPGHVGRRTAPGQFLSRDIVCVLPSRSAHLVRCTSQEILYKTVRIFRQLQMSTVRPDHINRLRQRAGNFIPRHCLYLATSRKKFSAASQDIAARSMNITRRFSSAKSLKQRSKFHYLRVPNCDQN